MKELKYLAIFGNVMFILWIVYNGIDEGSQGIGAVQATALIGLTGLLIVNIILLCHKK